MFELVVPAHNEEKHVGNLVRWARSTYGSAIRVIVIDNASTDRTSQVAIEAGADEVLNQPRKGKGFAVIKGLESCASSHVMLCDADIVGLQAGALTSLRNLVIDSHTPLGRLSIGRAPEDAPVTTLLARPLLAALGLADRSGSEPLGGLLMAERNFLLDKHLPGGWGFDVACTITAAAQGEPIPELRVQGVAHRHKPLAEYVEMANEVCLSVLRATSKAAWDHVDCTRCSKSLLTDDPSARTGDHWDVQVG